MDTENQDKDGQNDLKGKDQVPENQQTKSTDNKEDDPNKRMDTDNQNKDSQSELTANDQVTGDGERKLTDDKEDKSIERRHTGDQSKNEIDTTDPGPTQNVNLDNIQTGETECNNPPKTTKSSSISDLSDIENPEGDKIHLKIDVDVSANSSSTSQEHLGACSNLIPPAASSDVNKQGKGKSTDSAKKKKKKKEDDKKFEKKIAKKLETDKRKKEKAEEKRRKIEEDIDKKQKEKEKQLKKVNDKKNQEDKKAVITKASLQPKTEPKNMGSSVDNKNGAKTEEKPVLQNDGNQAKTEAVSDDMSTSLQKTTATTNKAHETVTQQNSPQASDNQTNANTTDEYAVTVYFHAIFSPTILQNHEKDDVFVRVNAKDVRMNYKRTINTPKPEHESYQYEGMTVIKKSKTTPWTVTYNYFVKVGGKEEIEEFIFNQGQIDFTARTIPSERMAHKDFHHQFDGVVRRKLVKEKGMLSYVSGFFWKSNEEYQKLLRKDVSLSFETFLPEWKTVCNGGINGKQLIDRVRDVYHCLKMNYWSREKLWPSFMDYDKYTEPCLKQYLERGIALLVEKKQSEKQNTRLDTAGINVTAAVTIVFLQDYYKVVLNVSVISNLCTALLPNISTKQTCSNDLQELKKNFLSLEGKLKERLLNFVKSLLRGERPFRLWLYCLPTLHYIEGRYQPFQTAPASTNHRDEKPVWWGIDSFKLELDTFKRRPAVLSDKEVLGLIPYFELDYLLPRTLVASMSFTDFLNMKENLCIPVDVMLAAVDYFIPTEVKNNYLTASHMQNFKTLFSLVSESACKSYSNKHLSLDDAERSYKIGTDVAYRVFGFLPQSTDLKHRTKFWIATSECFLVIADWFYKLLSSTNTREQDLGFVPSQALKSVSNAVCHELKEARLDKWGTEKYIQLWNDAFKIRIPEGDVRTDYKKCLQSSLKECLKEWKTEKQTTEIIDIYCNDVDTFEPGLQEILSMCALEAVDKCVNYLSTNQHYLEGRSLRHYGSLMSHVFERNIDEEKLKKNKKAYLEHALKWPPFLVFAKMYRNVEYSSSLQDTCLRHMKIFVNTLNEACKALVDGSITIDYLDTLLSGNDRFQSIVQELHRNEAAVILTTLQIRDKELSAFRETMIVVKDFVYECKKVEGDVDDLERRLRQFTNLNQDKFQDDSVVRIKDVCKVQFPKFNATETAGITDKQFSFEGIQSVQTYKPIIIAFNLSEEELNAIPLVLQHTKAYAFKQIWIKNGRNTKVSKGRKLKVNEILTEVWPETREQWTSLCEKLRNGDLCFVDFEEYFYSEECNNSDKLAKELVSFTRDSTDCGWIKSRFDQFHNFQTVYTCLKGANAIMNIVGKYGLEGDFSHITQIIKITKGDDVEMKKFDVSLVKTCSILRGIDDKKVDCLTVFCKCQPLVDWLKDSMTTGLKELKVFVELASMSAGETDIEVDRVQFLHAATTGYAPLIFNLDPNCNDLHFIEMCESVWKELETDPKLPQKLRDTHQQLDWLKSVKQSHGSVEVSSLSQTEAINASGTYEVGNSRENISLQKPALKDVLALSVIHEGSSETEDTDDIKEIYYKYEQLLDLQSRLMLVAGKAEKGKDEVDRFMLILDSVVRLGNIYIKLVTDGCVLFNFWHATFFCDIERPVCAFLNFGYGKDMHTIKGRTDSTKEDVSFLIPKIAKVLENCHKEWLQYINNKREENPLLNYFTIDQIVILQQQLVKVGTDKEPSPLIYPLLSAVKKNCSREELISSMATAKQDVTSMESKRDVEQDIDSEPGRNEEIDENIKKIMKDGFSLSLAKEAWKESDNIEDAIDWCYDHDENFVEEEEKEAAFSGWTDTEQSMASLTRNLVSELGLGEENAFRKLKRALKKLWKNFLSSISSSVSDYLSVEHLGLILKRLAEKETFHVCRELPSYFKIGEPNLLICEESDMYNTVLTIYSQQEKTPLPQSDEVLLCTPYTTLDMVEIFWRRTLDPCSNKIYCLVNAACLDYDISDKAEKTLQRLLKDAEFKESKYRLIVLCSTENENQSVIVRALAKFHRNQMPLNVDKIKKYLSSKLKSDSPTDTTLPACKVDFDRSTIRVVKSWRAGVGKTLFKKRMTEDLQKMILSESTSLTIPLHEKKLNTDEVMNVLLDVTLPPEIIVPRIFHFDISHEVQEGVDDFLFDLIILGCLHHSSGNVWRKDAIDYYIIESMPPLSKGTGAQEDTFTCIHHCLEVLPDILCRAPQESLNILTKTAIPKDYSSRDRLFDQIEFQSTLFQRPYQYLKRHDTNSRLTDINPKVPEGDAAHCLTTLLSHCGVKDPSWSELRHFVGFLDKQLRDFEVSNFCSAAVLEDLPGFPQFVLKFLIQMSRDFSTRSLNISEETPLDSFKRQMLEEDVTAEDENFVELYAMRRTWETSPHPYLFFNPDGHSMTFLGFNIEEKTGNLIDHQTKQILKTRIMARNLFGALKRNRVNLAENFDILPRCDKLAKLCDVMGVATQRDPDESYELTTDNVKKILAIYMRFRCGIPVIIMGETGCGKTRLIKFMCDLQKPPKKLLDDLVKSKETDDMEEKEKAQLHEQYKINNMILMKVHGGTKASDIIRKVKKAEEIAKKNAKLIEENAELAPYKHMDTVLFFDEANTTEAIGIIKEITCDKSLLGRPIELHEKLKMVAACNPYRKHSEELIRRLEQAGLGYHVEADKTSDKLGRVPMRRLVYRVQPLPQSMLPLVWDFGQLNINVEEMYIKQMVLRYIKNDNIPNLPNLDKVVSKILTVSQDFMRGQEDECSFVSLRDVERVLDVMSWFYAKSIGNDMLFEQLADDNNDEIDAIDEPKVIDHTTRSLVLALGVCYHSCLKKRFEYRHTIAPHFQDPLELTGGANQIDEEISRCQSVLLNNIELANNIAKNQALKENVFMMVVCMELRIPMFLVGKPGSSKSLAKTIVADNLQGNAAHQDLFRNYKQVQMVSFQCSPLSTPEGIVGTFAQCASYQKEKDLNRFVSVVVLDEIGLAEDSPRMPLKTLHPLLEDGCPDDEEPAPFKKVAFIGISNWALDPAKMNRGILVRREVPNEEELINSAEGICSSDKIVQSHIEPMIPAMASAYLRVFKKASEEKREFFGLRDFYSLIKMLYGFIWISKEKPTWFQLKHSILRNFGGLEMIDPVSIFLELLSSQVDEYEEKRPTDPDCSADGMIQACLRGDDISVSESRYLLLLTENYGALAILQQNLFTMQNAVVIFGSSFPSDQEYTQVCRNINRIKVCMETGCTVILLNLENLYESLYDALNQYYVEFGGERYVDLGLGSHRVKCRVHRKFRLIVVAEKQVVYKKFPIPLINRLEKHFLSMKTLLSSSQLRMSKELQEWALKFCENKTSFHGKKKVREIGEAFLGYHEDTCPAVIQHVCQEKSTKEGESDYDENKILQDAKGLLLWCATPAAVLQGGDDIDIDTYFHQQEHESLADYISFKMRSDQHPTVFAQITTNSRILSTLELDDLAKEVPVARKNIHLLTLQSFHTEQQFSRQIKSCFGKKIPDSILIVQSESGDQNEELIACARYSAQRELQEILQKGVKSKIYVIFLVQLTGLAGNYFSGYQCGLWQSVHIDDLRISFIIPPIIDMLGKSAATVITAAETNNSRSTAQVKLEKEVFDRDGEKLQPDENNEEMTQTDSTRTIDQTPEETLHTKGRGQGNEEKENRDQVIASITTDQRRKFDTNSLILNCVQRALSALKDPEEDASRTTQRLKIVLNLLENDGGTVLSGICKHVVKLINEKEKQFGSLSNWLSAEVSKSENINKAGTFRKSIIMCLESRIIPILAGLFAFMDSNRNLDILTENESNHWNVSIWLDILNDPEITQIKYQNMVSPTKHLELHEVAVKPTSVEGKVFSAKMSFSWLIIDQVQKILKTTIESEDTTENNTLDIIMKAAEIFQSLSIGCLLHEIDGPFTKTALKFYIEDFVHTVYPFKTENECRLVCENVAIGAQKLLKGEYGNLLPTMFACHMVYETFSTRFKNFSHIMTVWPSCCEKIIDVQQTGKSNLMTIEEITLDIQALTQLMDEVKPSREILSKKDSRKLWLRKVCEYRPVIERVVADFCKQHSFDGNVGQHQCREAIKNARCEWIRTLVVKLFIENVCTQGIGAEIVPSMKLWSKLGEDADMKELISLEKVESHLKKQNAEVLKKCFGVLSKCINCEAEIQSAPVKLSCNHVVCKKCYKQIIEKKRQCTHCKEKLPDNFNQEEFVKRSDVEKYEDFRERCNGFFMEIVSQLCFAEGTLPSQGVIDKLLSYIVGKDKSDRGETIVSRQLTVFQDAIDPNPVVRSFLLQEIMQTSGSDIKSYLSKYFDDNTQLLQTSVGSTESIELCLLILQCMEDSIQQQNQKFNNSKLELVHIEKMLSESVEGFYSNVHILEKIECIAKAKYSLSVTARYIHDLYGKTQDTVQLDAELRQLFEAAGHLCENSGSQWPRKYFVRVLCRSYGTDVYQAVLAKSDREYLRWVILPDLNVMECYDRYIVNEDYTDIRLAVADSVINQKDTQLTEVFHTKVCMEWQCNINLLLALHREITMNNLHDEKCKMETDKTNEEQENEFITDYLQTRSFLPREKEVSLSILKNDVWQPETARNIHLNMDIAQQNLTCLLTHYMVMMTFIPGSTTLLMPLKNIALNIGCMKDSYYPSMPDDVIAFFTRVMRDHNKEHSVKSQWGDEDVPTIYKCPQGHPYTIGDCGKAYFEYTCFCGEKIGGKSHILLTTNKQASSEAAAKGHILGRANSLKATDIVTPRNNLSRGSFAIIRLLTHMSMFIAANSNVQAVQQIIKTEPDIQETEVFQFLLEHINLDIESLHQILGKGKDDIFLMIHFILNDIVMMHTSAAIGENNPDELCKLSTEKSRCEWEDLFDQKFIFPVLQNIENVLQKCNDKIAGDKRMGALPLVLLLHEKDDQTNIDDNKNLQEIPEVWRFRSWISIDHLTQMLNTKEKTCPLLHLFLMEDHHLRVLRFIPNIIRLQKMLMQKYSRKLDRAEGTLITIEIVEQQLEQDGKLEEFKTLLQSYTEAWEAVRQSLETYTCRISTGRIRVNKAHCRKRIDGKTPVSYLLPTYRDSGLCGFILLWFLLEKQNTFLGDFCREKGVLYTSLPRVSVKDISAAHLISYHPDKDLLPMVLANCNYSFEVGQGTKVEYNFNNLERQVMDRFLFSKSVIINLNEIEMFTYRAEYTNGVVLESLSERIDQIRIPQATKVQICSELRKMSYPDLCESLDKLDIAISFLKSVGPEKPDHLLSDFMTKTLKTERPFPSQKAQQSITCSQTMSWWMNLALERAKALLRYKQEPFEGLADKFNVLLTDEQQTIVDELFSTLPIEPTANFIELMFEFIILRIDIPEDQESEDYIDISNSSLRDYLMGFPDSLPYQDDVLVDSNIEAVLERMPAEDNNITVGHTVDFWKFVNTILANKQQQRV
ncbi:E3 ubiquitin-protein ligase rnf213-alpha-like isoform X5 [Mytilus californianus]|nr:E3 ubiquitin-protein ligase rnf213-alpha-like isoform X5 [Mytilus californianus]XP_052087599.1 E3 ubiquitin-protein ligase rnf213-alpha-like isoform X5 [Mytilus californianus]XP_052087600.1 E3 ubiquitin-protein ligase rnf213-alpha-like isoform X5 [Mytilus californianus]